MNKVEKMQTAKYLLNFDPFTVTSDFAHMTHIVFDSDKQL